jgi:hypothetical protein
MQRLSVYDAFVQLQQMHKDKIVMYNPKKIEFQLADGVKEAGLELQYGVTASSIDERLLEDAGRGGILLVRTEETEKLLATPARGITKTEMRRTLAAGYSMPLEELTYRVRGELPGSIPMLMPYDITEDGAEREEEMAKWPTWRQKVERELRERRVRQQRRAPVDWEIVMDALSVEEWKSMWEHFPYADQVSREYRALDEKGLLKPMQPPTDESYEGLLEGIGSQ